MQKALKINFNYHFKLENVTDKKAVFKCINKLEKEKLIGLYMIIPLSIGMFIFSIDSNFIFFSALFLLLSILSLFYFRFIKKKLNKKCFFDMKNNTFQLVDNKPKNISDIKNIYIIAIDLNWGTISSNSGAITAKTHNKECYQVNLLMKNNKCYNFSTLLNYSDAFQLSLYLSKFIKIEFNDLYLNKIMNQLNDIEINNFYKLQLKNYTLNIQKAIERYRLKERNKLDLKVESLYFCPNCNSNKFRLGHQKDLISSIFHKITSFLDKKKFIKEISPPGIIHKKTFEYEIFVHYCFCCGTELNLKNIIQTGNTTHNN